MPYFFSSGNFSVNVHTAFNEEVREAINLSGRGHDLAAYLKFIEDTEPADLSFRYVVIRNSDLQLAAFLYIQIQTFSPRNISLSGVLSIAKNILLKLHPFRIMVCGNLFAVNFPCIHYDVRLIPVIKILEVIDELGNREKADITVIKDLPPEFTREEMQGFNFVSYNGDMTMELQIKSGWNTIDDYYRSLNKKYYKRSKKIIAHGEKIRRTEFSAEDIRINKKRINELFSNVSSRQLIQMGMIGKDYFYEFKKRFPEKFSFTAYYLNELFVAFSSYIDHDDELEVHYIGIDYKFNSEFNLYFNMLFDATDKAIRERKKVLELGRTAREAKANLGCKPVYFNDYTRIKSSFTRRIVNYFEKRFGDEMGESWRNRHPFKMKNE
jgi:hypothetical protein